MTDPGRSGSRATLPRRLGATLRALTRSGLVLTAGFVLLGAVLMGSVLLSTQRQGDDARLRQALTVEVDLGNLLAALLDAEVGQRGYLLTGDAAFLAPYHDASDRLDRILARLEAAVGGSADQSAAFREIRGLIESKRAELARTLALRDGGAVEAALGLVRDKTGVVLMDGIRERIRRMDEVEDRAVADHWRQVQEANGVTTVITAVSLALMAATAAAALAEVRRRSMLAKFLPAAVASRLADGDPALTEGRTGPATVAFVDIRGFTSLSEDMAPAATTALLTVFRGAVSDCVHRNGGMVDKFIGDGALAVFGAFDRDPAAAARAALRFAEDLGARLADLSGGGPPLRIGIGLHHGDAFCGVVGAAERREFTVLGDTVNVASRIEAANKDFGTSLLVSEAVLAAAGADRSAWREVSRTLLRGHRQAVILHTRQ